MPISDAARGAVGAAALLLALAACDPAAMGGSGPTRTTLQVAGQPVVIAAPAGFCIDPASRNVSAAGGFVLVGDCARAGEWTAAAGGRPAGAAMTASVSPGGMGGTPTESLADLERFAGTAEGRAVLGRSGKPAGVRILASQTRGDVLYLLVEDRGGQPIPGIDRQFWRAFLEVNGRMTALSVLDYGGVVTPQQGFIHLAHFADAIEQANPKAKPVASGGA